MPDTTAPPYPPNCALRFRKLLAAASDCKGARLDCSAILVTADIFSSFKKIIASCSTFDELLVRTAADVSSASHVVLEGDGHTLIIHETEAEELRKKYRDALKKCVGCNSVPAGALTSEMVREAAKAVYAYDECDIARQCALSACWADGDDVSRALEQLRYIQSMQVFDRSNSTPLTRRLVSS